MPIQTAIDSISNSQGSPFGFKNRIINGGMVIDQRNAGASVTGSTTNPFSVDRWQTVSSQNSKFTAQQNAGSVSPPAGFINYLGVTSSSAYSVGASEQFRIFQSIEGLNVADLAWGTVNAVTVTLSFRVYSSLTGTFGGSLANNAYARSYPFTYTISSANTWTTVSVTIPGDTTGTWLTTNGNGLIVSFGFGVGSTLSGTAGTWATASYVSATGATSVVGTSGATFYITGVQLEKGSTATSFDYRPYGTELAMCQRYFYMLAKGTNTEMVACNYWGSSELDAYVSFKVPMRATPTAYQVTGTNYFNVDKVGGQNFDGFIGIIRANENGGMLYVTAGISGTNGFAALIHTNNANAAIGFQSEL